MLIVYDNPDLGRPNCLIYVFHYLIKNNKFNIINGVIRILSNKGLYLMYDQRMIFASLDISTN